MESFYITLPSNVQNGGTISRYITQLPYNLSLPGPWEIALTEMYIPHAWNNIDDTNDVYEYYEGDHEQGLPPPTPPATALNRGSSYIAMEDNGIPSLVMTHMPEKIQGIMTEVQLPHGYYNTITELLSAIHAGLSPLAQRNIHFKSNMDRTVTITTRRNAVILLKQELAEMLGFEHCKLSGKITGTYAADERRGLYSAVVYSNIILPQVVGNVQAPILRFVPIDGKPGKLMVHRFPSPDYIPLSQNNIDSIEIDIRTDHGTPLVFQYGKVLCKLHFRPCYR